MLVKVSKFKFVLPHLFKSIVITFLMISFTQIKFSLLAMEESASDLKLQNFKVAQVLPLHRIIATLLLEKLKDEFRKERADLASIYQNYIENLQDTCFNPSYLTKTEINKFNYQNSIKETLCKIISASGLKNSRIKDQIARSLMNISNEEIKDIIDNLNKIYCLAITQNNNTLEKPKDLFKDVKIKEYLNILFFSCCILVRKDIRKESFKNMLEFFLLAGADINAQYFKKNRTPMLEIILNGQRGIGAILLFKKKVEPEDQKEWENEIRFRTNNQPEKICSYKSYNKNETKQIRKNHKKITEMFLKYGANADLEDIEGFTPLLQASKLGVIEIVKLLVEKYKVQVDKQDKVGNTALIIAVTNSFKEIVELLLKNHANPTIENLNKISPLKLIAYRSNNQINFKAQLDYQLAQLLLEHIANNQKEILNKILKSASALSKNQDLFDLFLQYDNDDQFEKGI